MRIIIGCSLIAIGIILLLVFFEPVFSGLAVMAGIIICFIPKKEQKEPEKPAPVEPPEPKSPFSDLYEEANLLSGKGLAVGWERTAKINGVRPKGDWLKYNGDRHLITIGPTGSGKGSTQQIVTLLWDRASSLVIDVKGQLCAVTTRYRAEKAGHKVVCLNPFGVLGLPTSTYNPLAHIDPHSITFDSDCLRIAEGLVDIKKADHWEISALEVVTILIMWVVKYEDEKSLIKVRQLLNLPDDLRKELFKKIARCDNSILAEGADRYTSDSREVRDCIQTAVVQLGFLRNAAVERVLRGNEISFADLKRKKMTVYVIIPPELLHTHGKFLRLIVMSALGELLGERTQPDEPVLFMLDEFAQLGRMDLIENAASVVRDYKIRLWIVLQNIPQLKALYIEKWESFLSSAGIIQLFTPNDMETAEYFSKRSGIHNVKRFGASESSSSGRSSGHNPGGESSGFNWSSGVSFTTTIVEAPICTPQDILGMQRWGQLLFCDGISSAIFACRGPYWELKFINDDAGQDPYHMTTEERAEFEAHARQSKTLPDAVKTYLSFLDQDEN